ncbi:phage portal protein, partial [Xenorhabdus bovienii]|nr:phage portal protein [Xenorhabdus bovienii]
RGDMKSRFEAYTRGINWGIYSPNECRELEELNPREGGDIYLTPMNMTTDPDSPPKPKTETESHADDDQKTA